MALLFGSTYHVEDYFNKSSNPGWHSWPLSHSGASRGPADIARAVEAAKRAQVNFVRVSPQFDAMADSTVPGREAAFWLDLANWTGSNSETGIAWQKTADGVTLDLDAWVNAFAGAGLQIMWAVGYGALWLPYAANGPNGEAKALETDPSPISGLNNQQMMAKYYAAYAGELAKRYGSAVSWWELWNEWTFYSSGSFKGFYDWSIDAYREMFANAAYEIKQYQPGAIVGWNCEQTDKIAGSSNWGGTPADQFFRANSGSPSYTDFNYQLGLHPGIYVRPVDVCDIVIPHVYPDRAGSGQVPENYLNATQQIVNRITIANNSIRARWNPPGVNGGVSSGNVNTASAYTSGIAGSSTRGNKFFVLGEFGWHAVPAGHTTYTSRQVSENKQAALTARVILESMTSTIGTSPDATLPLLRGAMQYDMVNDGPTPNAGATLPSPNDAQFDERNYGLFLHSTNYDGSNNLNGDDTYKIKPSGQMWSNLKRMLDRSEYKAPTRTVSILSGTTGRILLDFPANSANIKLWVVWCYDTTNKYGAVAALTSNQTINVGTRNVQSLNLYGTVQTNLTKDGSNNVVVTANEEPLFIIDQGVVLTAPNAPASLAGTVITPTRVDLTWGNVANEDGYVVQRQTVGATVGFVDISGNLAADTVAYSDTAAPANASLQYRVRAFNPNGISAYSNVLSISTAPPLPAAPGNLQATAISPTSVQLNWTDNATSETAYDVERGVGAAPSSWTVLTTALAPDSVDYLDTTASVSTTYTYRVRARNTGGTSAYAQSNATTTLPPAPTAPSGVTASQPSGSSPTTRITWTNGTGQTSLEVQRRVGAGSYAAVSGPLSAATVTFDDTSAVAGTTYDYRVRAINSGGDAFSGSVTFTPTVVGAPAAPTNVVANAVSPTSVGLTWTDNATNETAYDVERGVGSSPSSWTVLTTALAANSVAYTDNGATAGTTYTYRVRSRNGAGTSAYGTSTSVTTPVSPPSAPTATTAVAQSPTSIQVTWTAPAGATTYQLERLPPGGSYTLLSSGAIGTLSFLDTTASPQQTYSYRVRGVNAGGNGAYGPVATATTPAAAPATPTNLRLAGAVSPNAVPLAWDDIATNETGYKIARRPVGGTFADLPISLGANTVSYTDASVTQNTTYDYQVRATGSSGDSAGSNILTVAVPLAPPAAPTNLIASTVSFNSVTLAWTDNAGNESSYLIERQAPGETGFTQIQQVGAGATTYIDPTVAASSIYSYRVRASNGAGNSAYSNAVTITTTSAPSGGATRGVTTVRDGSSIIATLLYPPDARWQLPRARVYSLARIPTRLLYATMTLRYGFVPQTLMSQLLALPTDREIDFYLPVMTNSTNTVRWSWVRGVFQLPTDDIAQFTPDQWDSCTFTLTSAREVG